MPSFVYQGEKTKEIVFPLGGIGSGSIGLAGNGRLVDWEIFNRPNKRSVNSFSHFSVKAEAGGKLLDARVLNGDLLPSYMGERRIVPHSGYGFGPESTTMAGVPHFRDCVFTGEFPLAKLEFTDERFPGAASMRAFNPFIPLNDADSSIPGAFFEIELTNTTDQLITYTVNASVGNPHTSPVRWNRYKHDSGSGLHHIQMGTDEYASDSPKRGDISISTDAADVSYQEYWYRGTWCDNLEMFWRDFTETSKFNNRTYENQEFKGSDLCSLAAHVEIEPGQTKSVRFVITWNYPNCFNYWSTEVYGAKDDPYYHPEHPTVWSNYYASLFENSVQSGAYSLRHWDRLYGDTLLFKEALFSSSIPVEAIDAISANISTLKTATCLRLADGSFYGFEGTIEHSGCCEGSCTHVWNYAYALPFLFPKLERSMRDLDYKYNMREDGRMSFRLMLPLGKPNTMFACADGQFGGVVKAYRDWKISGDTDWLRSSWPSIQKSIEYAWAETNEHKWDLDKDGVLEGRQHHTLDLELFGPNAWLNGFYLAALKAGAEMARYLGDTEKADEYAGLFEQGKKWTDEHLFNGEYYVQQIDLTDRSMVEGYEDRVADYYWNEESGELKYQIGDGCGVDQVIAQWHANLSGLGEIFDPVQTKQALRSIYSYNYRVVGDYFNAWRLFSLNDEAGLIICSWPKADSMPRIPLTYNQETMNGFEYQAAIHMIQEGMVQEGMEIVRAIRARYDGERRNPWNEFECGSHYARSMASYALLPAFSGFEYDMVEGMIGFNPVQTSEDGQFTAFWSLDSGWGTVRITRKNVELHVLYGTLSIRTLRLPFLEGDSLLAATLAGDLIPVNQAANGDCSFASPVVLTPQSSLSIFVSNTLQHV
ncbi:GH116 family glycosyl-hydrolase [Paenibacillus sp. OV219]|uniref:GH116 family glycosyl-hydrolase n=1 Tax=Paenibacillus sp. OV219 TaxID=1884377 RepID=UPI0008BBA877|nr:GH116 family glycosyl-hydrolase [Paenibacillus sp. OV219]SEO88659.1 Uncharacterized protein, contains GBA2_N and DUF608 domains [Paenibacillus sp. OV219]